MLVRPAMMYGFEKKDRRLSWSYRVEHAQIFIGRDQKGQRDNSC